MITKILRNIFISVGLLFTVGQLLAGGMSDGVLHLGDMSLGARPPTYTNVDPPGSVFTFPQCINPAGVIAGEYAYADFVPHGFVRARDGIISTFDNPAGAFPIVPLSINPPGMIAGVYLDASNVFHGFLRTAKGTITTFDAPGAGTGSGQGTIPLANNPAGAITGYYIDASNVTHGFLRTP